MEGGGSGEDGVVGEVLVLTEADWKQGQEMCSTDGRRVGQAEVVECAPQETEVRHERRPENPGVTGGDLAKAESLESFIQLLGTHVALYVSSGMVGRIRECIARIRQFSKKSHVNYASTLERMLDWERVRHLVDLLGTVVPQEHLNNMSASEEDGYGRKWRIPMSRSTASFSHQQVGDITLVLVAFYHEEEQVILSLKGYKQGPTYIIPTVEIAWHAIWCCMQQGRTSVKRIQEFLQPRLYHMHRSVIHGFKLCILQLGDIRVQQSLSVRTPLALPRYRIPGHLLFDAIEKGGGNVENIFRETCSVLHSRGVEVQMDGRLEKHRGASTGPVSPRLMGQDCGTSYRDEFDDLLDLVRVEQDLEVEPGPPETTAGCFALMEGAFASLNGRSQTSIDTLRSFADVVLGTQGMEWMLGAVEEAGEVEPVLTSILEGLRVVERGRNDKQRMQLVSGLTNILDACGTTMHERVEGCRLFFQSLAGEGDNLGMLSLRIRYMLQSHWFRESDRVWFTSDWHSLGSVNQREVECILDQCNLELVSVKQMGDEKLANALGFLLLEHGHYAPPSAWQTYAAISLASLVIRCKDAGGCSHKDLGTFNGSLLDSVQWMGVDEDLGTEEELEGVLKELRMHLYEGSGQGSDNLRSRLSNSSRGFATRFLMEVVAEPPVGRPLELPSGFPYCCLHVIPFLVGTWLIVVRIVRLKVGYTPDGVTTIKSTFPSLCGRSMAVWDVFGVGPKGEVITGTFGTYNAARKNTGASMPFILLCEGGQGQLQYYPILWKSQLKPYKDAIGSGNQVMPGQASLR